MRRVAGWLVAIGVALAAVAVVKHGPPRRSDDVDSTRVSAGERDRITRFWDVYRRATAHRIAGEWQEAADDYARALALSPGHHDALYYLGNVAFDLGDLAAAERAWRRLVELDPTSARAHSQLGTLYSCVGEGRGFQPDSAAAEFQRAAAINREETGPLLSLGELALLRGDLERARHYFDAVMGSNYSSVEAHFYKGYIAWKRGASADAADLLRAAASYARPAPSRGAGPGEGDTRSDAASTGRGPAGCGVLRARATELVGQETAGGVGMAYRAFDDLLRNLRRTVPSPPPGARGDAR